MSHDPSVPPAFRPGSLEETQPGRVAPIDRSLAPAIPLLASFGALWLVVAAAFGLVARLQLELPGFLACESLTHGHLRAAESHLLFYGWGLNAALAVLLWVTHRLGKVELRVGWAPVVGGLGLNLLVGWGTLAILGGGATGVAGLEMPRSGAFLLAACFATVALWCTSAFSRRHTGYVFVSQWYALAAVLAFPLAYLLAQASVLWWPSRGVVQAIAAAWYGQMANGLFLVPAALAALYYVLPKTLGRPVSAYYLAVVGFWTYVIFAPWSGAAQLVGSPVPVWVQSVGVVASAMLVVPAVVVILNLVGTWVAGPRPSFREAPSLRFAGLAVAAFALWGLIGTVLPFRSVSAVVRFSELAEAHALLGTQGFIAPALLAALYYLLPRVTERAWPSLGLISAHFTLVFVGVMGGVATAALHGWSRSHADAAITADASTWAGLASLCQVLVVVGHLAFLLHVLLLLAPRGGRRESHLPSAR